MATSLLQTKLYIPPSRPELVPRLRLLERLNAGLRHKLTLISAPAGFGKTTLVSEWAHRRGAVASSVPRQVAWLSLDESDNDPIRFLTYLLAALQAVSPGIGKGALAALESPQPPPIEASLTALINELAALPEPVVLVLDDYHLIHEAGPASAPVHDAVTFLLEHLPPPAAGPLPAGTPAGLHLVIATREDPPLPLARLRARGQLTELRAADLRFTPTEAAEFLNRAMGLGLAADDIAALETRTEGWIVGLQLAALALLGSGQDTGRFIQSFTGSHRFVLDYLVEEVLRQQPESIQSFMLQTAILDRMTGPLCDAVRFGAAQEPPLGGTRSPGSSKGTVTLQSSAATLESLDRANLFVVPLDEDRRWYRYHHLFADLLRQRLYQTQPEQVPTLHQRASEWHRQNGFVDQAIEHALHAGQFERAAGLIEEHVDAIWERGEHTTLRRWLGELPDGQISANPHLCIVHAWNLFSSGQHGAARDCLQAAERALANKAAPAAHAPVPGSEAQIRGRIETLRAFLALYDGDLPETVRRARRAFEILPEQDLGWRTTAGIALGDAYSLEGQVRAAYRVRLETVEASRPAGNLALIAGLKLADTCRQRGRLQQAVSRCEQQWQRAQEGGLAETVSAGWLLAIWGETLAELNDLDRALERALQGVERTERGQDAMVTGWSRLCLVRVLFSRGELDAAQEIVDKLEASARGHELPPFITHPAAAWQARIWLAEGKLEAASEWARERGREPADASKSLALARIRIAQGRQDEVGALLLRLIERAQAGGHTSRTIEGLVLQACALRAQANTERALSVLEQALLLAEPGGSVRTFVDEGPPVAGLLYRAAAQGIAPAYATQLLAAFPAVEAPPAAQPQISVQPAVGITILEPLSEREIEVLQLLAEGLTNPEIASRLTLAQNTIKSHTRSIYGKLDVHNRTQAVGKARALGLLPST